MCVYFLGLYDISLPLPTLSQIRGHKRRHFVDTTDGEDEFEKVSKLVEELGDQGSLNGFKETLSLLHYMLKCHQRSGVDLERLQKH